MGARQEKGTLILAGASVRALAASARRAGYAVCGLDCYGDEDTRELCDHFRLITCGRNGLDGGSLRSALTGLAPGDAPLVPAGGMEGLPGLLADLQRGHRLCANTPQVFRRFTDPARFFPLLDACGIPYPETRLDPPPAGSDGWLRKRAGGCGGGHVRRWRGRSEAGEYFQRETPGRPCSVCFLADGSRARILGHSRLLTEAQDIERPWRYGGCIAFRPGVRRARELERIVAGLVLSGGLRGLCGMDYLELDGGAIRVLEVNPRPVASFELFEGSDSLVEAHLRALQGRLPTAFRGARQLSGIRVIYLRQPLQLPANWRWPEWCRDRPAPGSRLAAGEPLCTIQASAAGEEAVRETLEERARSLLGALGAGHEEAGCPPEGVPGEKGPGKTG